MTEVRARLLPGTLMSARSYDAVKAHVGFEAEGVEWMVDAPLCDIPQAASLVAETIAMCGAPAILVGHSTGGAIAAFTALNYSDLVSGLVLINSGPNMVGHGAVTQILETLNASPTDEVWERFAMQNVPPGSPRCWIDDMVSFSKRAGGATAASVLHSQAQLDLLTTGWTSDLPVEVLHGKKDTKRTPANADEWRLVFPNAKVTLLDDCGHSPPLEAPHGVASAIRRVASTIHQARV